MKKRWFCVMALGAVLTMAIFASAQEKSTELFSVEVPEEVMELGDVGVGEKSIAFYEKISREEFGGFVGELSAYGEVSDYCYLPHFSYAGELSLASGDVYQMVWRLPSDVQVDLQSEEARENYGILREAMEQVESSIQPLEEGIFIPAEEVDHASIFDGVLDDLCEAIEGQMDVDSLLEAGFSSLYAYEYGKEDPFENQGYAYIDMQGTSFPLLAIILPENGMILDLFSQAGGEVHHVLSSAERQMYFFKGQEGYAPYAICCRSSQSAMVSDTTFYGLDPVSEELYFQVRFLFDEEKDPENPYFVQYSGDEEMEALPEEEWTWRMDNYGEDYHAPDLMKLSDR